MQEHLSHQGFNVSFQAEHKIDLTLFIPDIFNLLGELLRLSAEYKAGLYENSDNFSHKII